ncbi:adenylate/guanylate cyclase domain-containing protein [Spirulina sp. 06S082]|uniref:adenylate/guanylate cyclase domain-containing protein n=1 Tax=Spirulina sp. 06S082 TaxID=3110248 RepID=UPI002B213D1E|nr:adenylate/guanylate cyclase domain-containing protein [Spirulina sp. 06S082]MEA5471769.1 adenylate/guanylate cyclase domain-containing protein [Spirulina sp. 06S082]
MQRKFPLRLVIVIPTLLQIFAAVGLTGFLSWRNGQQAVTDLATQLSQKTSDRIETHIRNYLETSELILKINELSARQGRLNVDDFSELQRYFWQQTQLSDASATLYYGSETGDFLQIEQGDPATISLRTQDTAPFWNIYRLNDRGERQEWLQKKEYDPRIRPWYRAAKASKTLIWSPIYVFAQPSVLGITSAIPIYRTTGELQGVMAIDLTLSQIGEFLQALEIGTSGASFIIERSGEIVATSSREYPFLNSEGQERLPAIASRTPMIQAAVKHWQKRTDGLTNLENDSATIADAEGNRYFVRMQAFRNDRGIDWLLGVVIPEADFKAEIAANTRATIVICAIALVLAAALGIITSRLIAKPVLKFAKVACDIARGDLLYRIPPHRIEELDSLARAFNLMAIQLHEAFSAWEDTNKSLEILVGERTEALRRSEEKFAKAFRSSPYLVGITNLAEGRILEVNDTFLHISGYALGEIIGKTAVELGFWGSQRDRVKMMKMLDNEGRIRDREFSFRIASGDIRILRLSVEKIEIDNEDCLLMVANDITERKRMEASLQEKEQSLRLILDTIPQQVFWKDTDSVFLGCNQNWAEAAHLNHPEEAIGKTDYDMGLPREIADLFRQEDRKIMEADEPVLHKIAKKQRPGENGKIIWLDISKVPLHDIHGNVIGLIGVIDDITPQKEAMEALKQEREKSEALLLNILPHRIVEQLKKQHNSIPQPGVKTLIAEHYETTTILFADIVGFTPFSAQLSPITLVDMLNDIFSAFDRLADDYNVEKIKTIGDAYMVAGGLQEPEDDRAEAIAAMALEMLKTIAQFRINAEKPCQIRIGIHTGAVVAGVIGIKKFIYDLWGDTVNVASRMESTGEPGKIQVTAQIYEQLKEQFVFEKRGAIAVKGKGEMITYWLIGKK